jgi:hypothetical protein
MVGVPSHDNFVASNCAPGAPMRGPSGASRAISAIEVREIKVASLGNGTGAGPMTYIDTNSAEVQQLKSAALPLIMRLNLGLEQPPI